MNTLFKNILVYIRYIYIYIYVSRLYDPWIYRRGATARGFRLSNPEIRFRDKMARLYKPWDHLIQD